MGEGLIVLEKFDNGVAKLELNNPPLNLVTLELTRQLITTLEEIEADDGIRAVVMVGAGSRAFCAGSDIKEFPDVLDDVIEKKLRKENEAFSKIEFLSKPVIAALEGITCGGGCEIAIACDFRIISAEAQIGLPEIKLGVFPGSGGLFRLPRLVGPARALEMMYLGRFLNAHEALQYGLVQRIVPSGQTVSAAMDLAEEIAAGPREALQFIKKGVRESFHLSHEDNVELTLQMSEKVFKTKECVEGVNAFFEKRKPNFTG